MKRLHSICLVLVAICGVSFFSAGPATAGDRNCNNECLNKKKLILAALCSSSYDQESRWSLTNPNAIDLAYSWTLDGSDPAGWGYGLIIPANSTVSFSTPVGGDNTVSIYVDGMLNATLPREVPCDCNGVPGGPVLPDDCGVCGGDNSLKGCDGICGSGKEFDTCGVCDGDNSAKGCDNVCFSGAKVDSCGLCGGDGSTCLCSTKTATTAEIKLANKVVKTAKVLRSRVSKFSLGAARCSGKDYSAWISRSNQLLQSIKEYLNGNFTNSIQSCVNVECTDVSTTSKKKTLNAITRRLYRLAKIAKLQAIQDCPPSNHDTDGPVRKNTEGYRDDVLQAIKSLPQVRTECTK